jgi:excisionase family DNA binding protein
MKTHPQLTAKKIVSIDPSQKSFSVPQCACYLGLSHWQVRMAIWQGRLSARRVGKSLLILRSDADKFLDNLPTVSANNSAWLARRTNEVRP